jgi:hypothetical protein
LPIASTSSLPKKKLRALSGLLLISSGERVTLKQASTGLLG